MSFFDGPRFAALAVVAMLLALAPPPSEGRVRCGRDAVAVGPVCVDRYEASVWSIPAANDRLIARLQNGKADAADLAAGGAVQLGQVPMGGCTATEYPPEFPLTGNWTAPLYAASVAGVPPSTCITWFQAEQACRLAGKRLLRNEEWQGAAAGTPDPNLADDGTTTCATNSAFAVLTGARGACVSAWGVHDMAGNVWEWVADWVPPPAGCTTWDANHGGDLSCMGVTASSTPPPTSGILSSIFLPPLPFPRPAEIVSFDPNLPGAMIRGGNYATGNRNGIFAIDAATNPSHISRSIGFRCAR